MMQPGWYYAQGDPPGTQRYWDGELWQGEPVAAPPMQTAATSYGYNQQFYPETSQATTALVLGILGIVICGLCAPFAWYIGGNEVKAIDAGRRDPSNRGSAQAGRILGIIVSILGLIGIALVIVIVIAGASSGSGSGF